MGISMRVEELINQDQCCVAARDLINLKVDGSLFQAWINQEDHLLSSPYLMEYMRLEDMMEQIISDRYNFMILLYKNG